MTLSINDRKADANKALCEFLSGIEGQHFDTYIAREKYPHVLPTTWTELVKCRWLREMDMNVEYYRFTVPGYVQALKVSQQSDEPAFREGLGRICKVLKGCLKGRTECALVIFDDLITQAGVSSPFASNAIDCDLIRYVLGRVGAEWDGEHLIRVPNDFGHPI